MIVRYCAEFRSTLPDDSIEDEEGREFLQFSGKNVATAVSEILRRIGYEADDPMAADNEGWEFEVRVKGYPKGVRLWCNVAHIHKYLLVFDNTSSWDKFRKRHPAPYIEALRALGREMAADPRFSEVQWKLPGDETDRPGSPQPVDDQSPRS